MFPRLEIKANNVKQGISNLYEVRTGLTIRDRVYSDKNRAEKVRTSRLIITIRDRLLM